VTHSIRSDAEERDPLGVGHLRGTDRQGCTLGGCCVAGVVFVDHCAICLRFERLNFWTRLPRLLETCMRHQSDEFALRNPNVALVLPSTRLHQNRKTRYLLRCVPKKTAQITKMVCDAAVIRSTSLAGERYKGHETSAVSS